MSLRPIGVLIAVLIGSPITAPALHALPGAKPAQYRVIDVMADFWRFWSAAEGKHRTARLDLFKEMVLEPHRNFYHQAVAVPDDERLLSYLADLEPRIATLRRLSDEFPSLLAQHWSGFVERFPDLGDTVSIYLAPSLFTSNGQVRYLDGRPIVMFGLDVTAYVDDVMNQGRRSNLAILVHHELFHYYHWQRNGEVAAAAKSFFRPGNYSALYYNLWSEGLATYVSQLENPAAPLAEVLFSDELGRTDASLMPRLAREFRRKLESTADGDVRDLFYLDGKRTDIPARSAYYVGLKVADFLAQRRTLAELVALDGPTLRSAIEDALAALEGAPPNAERH